MSIRKSRFRVESEGWRGERSRAESSAGLALHPPLSTLHRSHPDFPDGNKTTIRIHIIVIYDYFFKKKEAPPKNLCKHERKAAFRSEAEEGASRRRLARCKEREPVAPEAYLCTLRMRTGEQ